MNIFTAYFKALYKSRYVLLAFGSQDFKNKYRHSFLGMGWALLNPLMLVIVIGVVFSTIMGQPIEKFIPFLFAGLLPWMFLTEVAIGGANSFINAEGYINQIASVLLKNNMGYGHINVQLRMKDNRPYCFEINPRLSSTEGPKAQMGFNSVEAYLVNTILEKEYLELVPEKKQFLRFYEDVIF